MEKIKAFLTQKINKDSFNDHDIKRSIKLTICGALIIALMIQAIGCFCAPLTVSALDDDSIVGTWVIIDSFSLGSSNFEFSIIYNDSHVMSFSSLGTGLHVVETFGSNSGSIDFYTTFNGSVVLGSYDYIRLSVGSSISYTLKSSDDGIDLRTFEIPSSASFNVSDSLVRSYLELFAVKQVDFVYDFTGETRIFNDELTLFNTSVATWTEAFSFNFEVLGVGTADYLTLQRTTQNNYTMSYAFDFEGSGGQTMIYRDSPPFDDGNGDWLGGKVNRKVITFLSNPDDPDIQQWLLDNTELYDDVDSVYQIGFMSGYNNGYEEGFSNKLIGDTLKGPIEALSALTIIEVQGVAITLGGVVMTAIALCLVLAFLKLYAGG